MTSVSVGAGTFSVTRLLRPRSVAIVGMSADPASIGARCLASLERFGYRGDIYLVNPKRSEIDGRACVASVDDLPLGVDVAILVIPQAATVEAVAACVRRLVGAAVVFTSGFSESGAEGMAQQEAMTRTAREGGLALLGPNCYGLVNYVDGIPLTSGPVQPIFPGDRPALAIISQSGGMMGCLLEAASARNVPLSFAVSTGNEAVLCVEDFLAEIVEHPGTRTIAMFAEQLRQPRRFLALAGRARELGKAIVLLHSGRSERSREAAMSHTGALASDYATMATLVSAKSVVLVDDIEAVIDTAELLTLFPNPSPGGLAIITDSGAFKGLALDYCEAAGLEVSTIGADTVAALTKVMPAFADLSNPLDLTAQVMRDMAGMYGGSIRAMAADPDVGSLLVCLLMGAPQVARGKLTAVANGARDVEKPVVVMMLGGDSILPEGAMEIPHAAGMPFYRSGMRAIKALAYFTRHAAQRAAAKPEAARKLEAIPLPGAGLLAEYQGKEWLRLAGVPVPPGELARTVDEAAALAGRLGYPVVLKAQAADLTHKSDAGGVIVGLVDEAALRDGWYKMRASVGKARPDISLDGILVEKMGTRGLELVVGARRDPEWGPLLMIGLGGIWIEVLKDVRFLPADADRDQVIAALRLLKGAALLDGARGALPVDIDAVADVVVRLGQLMQSDESLLEIDINPLVALPVGQGVLALDALIVSKT